MKFGIVNITSFCNQKCIFCSEGDMHNNPKHIPYEKVISILDDLRNNGVEGINFMGGECTMRSDLIDILDYCNKNFKYVSIVTNGIMFSSYNYAKNILSKVNSFEFSWHTNNNNKFKILSGSETYNLFKNSLENIAYILSGNDKLGITINHVINKINYMDILSFVKEVDKKFYLRNKNNRFISLKRNNIIGYSIINKSILSISPEKVFFYLSKAIEYCVNNNIYVQIEGFPPCYFKKFFDSEFFIINEIDKEVLFLLNKIDISNIKKLDSTYLKGNYFKKELYLKGDIKLNKEILKKCKKCSFIKICHEEILLGDDSNDLNKEILEYIGDNISCSEININVKKRKKFLNNIIK